MCIWGGGAEDYIDFERLNINRTEMAQVTLVSSLVLFPSCTSGN